MLRSTTEDRLDETKSRLGKLLASEDIRIEHRQVKGPYFDVKERVLVLPIWKDMDADLYDLMIGHEVGHALFTPNDGWLEEVNANGASFKGFLNVVEDARIEKLMKRKYPGLKKPMYNGYTQLVDRGFFGIKLEEMKFLPFADRLNVYFKLGVRSGVSFNEKEQKFIDRVEGAETFDEIINLAKELMQIAKDDRSSLEDLFEDIDFSAEEDSVLENMAEKLQKDNGANSAEPGTEGEDSKESLPADKAEQKDSDANNQGGSSDLPPTPDDKEHIVTKYTEPKLGTPGGSMITQQLSDALRDFVQDEDAAPITEAAFNARQNDLINQQAYPITYTKLPKLRLKDWVVPAEVYHKGLKFCSRSEYIREKTYTDFLSVNKNYIGYLVKEFELRRNAKQMAKVRISKTGNLDLDRVWGYKFTENLFLQSAQVPNGKNHGMIMLIDMSSSMTDNIAGTIEQVVALTMFCRKVNIPFEVYGFNDNGYHQQEFAKAGVSTLPKDLDSRNINRHGMLQIKNYAFRLQQYFHNRMTITQFNTAVKNMLLIANLYRTYRNRYYSGYGSTYACPNTATLGGTPLNEALVVLRSVAEEFTKKTKVEILNTIVLTDGDGSDNLSYIDHDQKKSLGYYTMNIVIEDEVTRKKTLASGVGSMTLGLLDLYKQVTGSRVLGIYLMSGNTHRAQINNMVAKYNPGRQVNFDLIEKQFNSEFKNHKFFAINDIKGYDVFYMVPGTELEIKEVTMDTVLRNKDKAPTKNQLLKAFQKMQNTKQVSRVFLNQFVQHVS